MKNSSKWEQQWQKAELAFQKPELMENKTTAFSITEVQPKEECVFISI